MGSVLFDFDSTLVACESLEVALGRALSGDAGALAEIEAITRAGMEGTIPFEESLERRLAIARPTRDALVSLGEELAHALTPGSAELIAALGAGGHEVWIVSGAFRDTLLPVGRSLGLPDERVQGVRALWDGEGAFAGLDPGSGFRRSKIEGARGLGAAWARPAIGVGDGMTDHALLRAGLVDRFIAFTAHARREAVLATGAPAAGDMAAVRRLVDTWLHE